MVEELGHGSDLLSLELKGLQHDSPVPDVGRLYRQGAAMFQGFRRCASG